MIIIMIGHALFTPTEDENTRYDLQVDTVTRPPRRGAQQCLIV